MLSYTALRNKFAVLASTTNSTMLTNVDSWINDAHRSFIAETNGDYTEATATELCVADQQSYALPYNYEKMNTVTLDIDDFNYPLTEIKSRQEWDSLQLSSNVTAYPSQYYFIDAGKAYLYPTPAGPTTLTSGTLVSGKTYIISTYVAGDDFTNIGAASNATGVIFIATDTTPTTWTQESIISPYDLIYFNYKKRVIDLNTADITTSTITTLANGSTALTVSAGLTAQMVGFWIRPTYSTTANTGDGNWYEIESITSSTVAVLKKEYGGVSIAAGTAGCTISQMPIIPESFHPSLVDYAMAEYHDLNGDKRADIYRSKWLNAIEKGKTYSASKTTDMVIDSGDDREYINPNLTVLY